MTSTRLMFPVIDTVILLVLNHELDPVRCFRGRLQRHTISKILREIKKSLRYSEKLKILAGVTWHDFSSVTPAHGGRLERRNLPMKFKIKGGRLAMLLVPALALAAPAFAQVRPTTLSDSQEPGSVIVFPKFIQGTVSLSEGPVAPISELEI